MKLSTTFQDIVKNRAILAASFLMLFVNSGASKANALFFASLVKDRGLSRQEAAWPFNLFGAVTIVGAPFVSYISSRWPISAISFVGVLITSGGRIACFFNTDVYYLVIFQGIVRGVGSLLATQMLSTIITNSFEKNRGLAMALHTTSIPLGVFVFIPVIKLLLDEYGLNGAFLILGGMTLNSCLGTIVLDRYPRNFKKDCEDKAPKSGPRSSDAFSYKSVSSNKIIVEETTNNKPETNQIFQEGADNCLPETKVPLLEDSEHDYSSTRSSKNRHLKSENNTFDFKATSCSDLKNGAPPLYKNGTEVEKSNNNTTKAFAFNRTILKKIFTCRIFYLVTFTQAANVYLKSFFKFVIVDYVNDKGIGMAQGMYTITAYSAGEFVGRLFLGWLSDRGYISRQSFIVITMFASSIILFSLTFTDSYVPLMVLSAVLGMFMGTVGPSTMILYANYLRKEEIHLALSFSRSFKGIFSLTRAPLLGLFRDGQGSYDNLFYLQSGIGILASAVWFAEVMYRKKQKSKFGHSDGECKVIN